MFVQDVKVDIIIVHIQNTNWFYIYNFLVKSITIIKKTVDCVVIR